MRPDKIQSVLLDPFGIVGILPFSTRSRDRREVELAGDDASS